VNSNNFITQIGDQKAGLYVIETEENIYVLKDSKIYIANSVIMNRYFSFSESRAGWNYLARGIRFHLSNRLESFSIKTFELNEKIEKIYLDGELLEQ
jgi:hypothetical protein